jgi:hypothetical protein
MEDKKSPSKIKVEKQIFHHGKDRQMRWGDIKHLQLEDDDVIHSAWVEDDNFDGQFVMNHGLQFLYIHHHSAIAVETKNFATTRGYSRAKRPSANFKVSSFLAKQNRTTRWSKLFA